MRQTAKLTRENRTITVNFHDKTTYFALLGNTTAFIEFALAFLLPIGDRGRARHPDYSRRIRGQREAAGQAKKEAASD